MNFQEWIQNLDEINSTNISSTVFLGYEQEKTVAQLIKIITFENSNDLLLVFNQTVFYPRGGGQAGDQGTILINNKLYQITDTRKSNNIIYHYLQATEKPELILNSEYTIAVDSQVRFKTSQHHSATHILWALIEKTLNAKFMQGYEFIDENKSEIMMISNDANIIISPELLASCVAEFNHHIINTAIETNIYYENNDPTKRVVEFPNLVHEYCGGTHIKNTKQLSPLVIDKFKKKGVKHRIVFHCE